MRRLCDFCRAAQMNRLSLFGGKGHAKALHGPLWSWSKHSKFTTQAPLFVATNPHRLHWFCCNKVVGYDVWDKMNDCKLDEDAESDLGPRAQTPALPA